MNAIEISKAVKGATKKWEKQRKAEERAVSSAHRRSEAWQRPARVSQIDAAAEIIPGAYKKVSANGTLVVNARQLMYGCRGYIQERIGKPLKKKWDKYFTQRLLPDFMRANPELTRDWDIVFDSRGSLIEPHTKREVPLIRDPRRPQVPLRNRPPHARDLSTVDAVPRSGLPHGRPDEPLRRDPLH